MKKIFVLIVMVVLSLGAFAQAQELEQLKINLEKLVQLKLILARAKQGYAMLEKGYNSVRDISKGNFELHQRELNSLLAVRPAIKQMPALVQMQDKRSAVQGVFDEWLRSVQTARVFSAGELAGIRAKYSALKEMLADDATEVKLVLTSGVLRMNDAERMAAIELLASNTAQLCEKIHGLISEQSKIAAARMQDKKDREAMLRFYGKGHK
ncbi:MAG: hypothetical protein ACN4EP_07990 [Sediminibacterium sp.]